MYRTSVHTFERRILMNKTTVEHEKKREERTQERAHVYFQKVTEYAKKQKESKRMEGEVL